MWSALELPISYGPTVERRIAGAGHLMETDRCAFGCSRS
jgi:hypothetical protein